MHRMKIGLVAAIVLLALTAGVYVVVTRELKESVVQEVDTDGLARAADAPGDVARLEAMEFANLVAELVPPARGGRRVRQDRRDRPPAGRLRAVRADQRLPAARAASRKADIVAILDSSGKVLARDLNVNAMFGEDLRSKYPAVGDRAVAARRPRTSGRSQNRMTRVAVAPIVQPGRHHSRRAAGRLRADRARRAGQARPARHRGRLLPQRQGAHLELRLRGDGRERQGRRQQDPGAEHGAVPSRPRSWGQQALQKGAPDRDLPPHARRARVRGASRRRCTATPSTRPAAS